MLHSSVLYFETFLQIFVFYRVIYHPIGSILMKCLIMVIPLCLIIDFHAHYSKLGCITINLQFIT